MDIHKIKQEVHDELVNDIMPFWLNKMQDPRGGWYGKMDGEGNVEADAPKGAILNARILWTFSSAYRILKDPCYLKAATGTFIYIRDYFQDKEYGGVYWSLNADGSPLDTKKQFYAIAFVVYGLSEYYRASGNAQALELAISMYKSIEEHSYCAKDGGYLEASSRDWSAISDMRLSAKDRNDARTMNTHLHILEAYTALYRVWKDDGLASALKNLIGIFLDKILGKDGHLGLFFDENWNSRSELVSYGHDIEASWLLWEAVDLLKDEALKGKVKARCSMIALASLQGISPNGGMIYEKDGEELDEDRHWWVQAEALVGFVNQLQHTGDSQWEYYAVQIWDFIKEHIINPDGEWYWSMRADGTHNTDEDRAGFWKCPYHNGRMCMELLERIS